MSEVEIEHIVKVCDIADEERIKKEGLKQYFPPENHKILALAPESFAPMSPFKATAKSIKDWLRKKKFHNSGFAQSYKGLGLDYLAVPKSFETKRGDILKVNAKINKIGEDESMKKNKIYPNLSLSSTETTFGALLGSVIIIILIIVIGWIGITEYQKYDVRMGPPTHSGTVIDIDFDFLGGSGETTNLMLDNGEILTFFGKESGIRVNKTYEFWMWKHPAYDAYDLLNFRETKEDVHA